MSQKITKLGIELGILSQNAAVLCNWQQFGGVDFEGWWLVATIVGRGKRAPTVDYINYGSTIP
jgi:hypothetical protein